MANIFAKRTTRSQATLPDIQPNLECSPLKAARSALRQTKQDADQPLSGPSASANEQERRVAAWGGDEEDELLLSPGKENDNFISRAVTPTGKRPPSPQDHYSSPFSSPNPGSPRRRDRKRAKHDFDITPYGPTEEHVPYSVRHARMTSEPIQGTGSRNRKRSATIASKSSSPKSLTTGAGRARSVPLFPSLPEFSFPKIDLRHPPISPTRSTQRARSRSPAKGHDLLFHIRLEPTAQAPTLPDRGEAGMDVDPSTSSVVPPSTLR